MQTRSSLELMLDNIQAMEAQPVDAPPPLPARPASRARLPRARRPLQLDELQRRNSYSRRRGNEGLVGAVYPENSAKIDPMQKEIGVVGIGGGRSEEGISIIQKCYRGYRSRQDYNELRQGTVVLQSFVRGENARRNYHCRSRKLQAIVVIQRRVKGCFKRRVLEQQRQAVAGSCRYQRQEKDREALDDQNVGLSAETMVPYTVLADLQKRVLRSEARVREKNRENAALKARIQENLEKRQQYEERMKSIETVWQDQLSRIQQCLAQEAKKKPALDIRFRYRHNPETGLARNGLVLSGRASSLAQPVHQEEVDQCRCDEGYNFIDLESMDRVRVGHRMHPQEELCELRNRFKAWKVEYRNKLREVQKTFKKLASCEGVVKGQKHWWGRLSSS